MVSAISVSMLLITIWIVPYVKVWGVFALWHVVLAGSLVLCIRDVREFLLDRHNHALLIGILLLPIYMVFRDAFAGSLENISREYYLRNVGGLLCCIVMGSVLKWKMNRRAIMTTLFIIGIVNGVIGVLQFIDPMKFYYLTDTIADTLGSHISTNWYRGRVRGLFEANIGYGTAVGMLTFFFLPIVFPSKKWRREDVLPRGILVVGLISMILGMLLSYLRVFYICITVISIVHIYMTKNQGYFILCMFLFAMFVQATYGELGQHFEFAQIGRITNLHDESNVIRMHTINVAMKAFRENPICGVGGRNIELLLSRQRFEIHNAYVKLVAFYGILGISLYMIYNVIVYNISRSIYKKIPDIAIGLLYSFFYYAVVNMAHPGLFWLDGFLEWTFMGILFGYANIGRSWDEKPCEDKYKDKC